MTVSLARSRLAGAVLAALLAGAASAKPQDPPAARPQLIQALSDCRKITDDAGRLACYDKAAGELDQAESKGQVVVVDQAQASAVRRQAFGFRLPTLDLFSRSAPRSGEGVDFLNLELASAHRNPQGQWDFIATDGALWRQTDDSELANYPHRGSKMIVKHGALGSFFCKLDGQPEVRCLRVS